MRNWSGFDDYLWGVVAETDAVAIVWSDAHRMLGGGLGDLMLAVEAITDLARQVADGSESGFPRPVTLRLVLVGDGPDFPPVADG